MKATNRAPTLKKRSAAQTPARKRDDGQAAVARADPPRLNRDANLGYLLRDTTRLMMRSLQQRLEGPGITLGNWFILRELWETDGMALRALAVRMDLLGPSIVAAIDSMEKRDLVQRRRSATDRRQVHIFLTKRGRQLQMELQGLTREVSAVGLRDIDKADVERLRALLRIIRENYRTEQNRCAEVITPSKRWTAAEKATIILEVLRGEISVAEAAVKYSFSQTEYQKWTKAYHQAGKGALVTTRATKTSRKKTPRKKP